MSRFGDRTRPGGVSRFRRATLLGAALSAAALIAPAPSAAQPPAPTARLAGTFQMSGKVTAARYVYGEGVGQFVQRTWTFTPLCPSGPCAKVQLVRGRATGSDTLELRAVSASVYVGTGRFYAPLRCAGRIYPSGEAIPFRIRLTVRATQPAPAGGTMATAITATYLNTVRLNQTPCVAVLGHDSAHYTGTLAAG
jgi:hypothetical protein